MRRKSRAQDPLTIRAVQAGLATKASAAKVVEALTKSRANNALPSWLEGVITPEELSALYIPSVRTVQNIARDAPDDSDAWTFETSAPAEAVVVLRILSAVAGKSQGRVKHLTKREAQLAAVYQAVRPGIDGLPEPDRMWAAYVRARSYLAQLNRGEDPAAEHLHTADMADIEAGLEYRPGMIDPTLKEQTNG